MKDKIKKLEDEADDRDQSDDDDENVTYDNSDFVGLDTINWSLDKGNLKVEQQMEAFIESLRKQNCVGVPFGTPLFN